jgi:hypothetical protein
MGEFDKLLYRHIEGLNYKFRNKFSIKQSLYDKVILALRDVWGESQIKCWVNENFKSIKVGDPNAVYEIKSKHPVLTYESLYTKIKECYDRLGYHGRDKSSVEVCSMNIYNRITGYFSGARS